MTSGDWRQLALTSVTDPAAAARSLMALALPRDVLWTGLALVAVLNTILFIASNMLVPVSMPVPGLPTSPVSYLALIVTGLVLTIYAVYWAGRGLGGQGSLNDVMIVLLWLQGLRVVVQFVALVLMLIVPGLAVLLVFAAALVGLYILLNFVNQAHRLDSLARSAGVLIAALLAMVLALSLAISILGGLISGSSGNV